MLEDILQQAADNEEPVTAQTFTSEDVSYINAGGIDLNRVKLTGCTFENCSFSGTGFLECTLTDCRFISCDLTSAYFRSTTLENCSASGCRANRVLLRKTNVHGGFYRYADFSDAVFEDCELLGASFAESALMQVKLKRTVFRECDLSKADILGTAFKGIDLSDCDISGILMSESLRELRGAKINTQQAAQLIRVLDIEVIG